MGYEYQITRAEFWPRSEENPISLEEWQALVSTDDELEQANKTEHANWLGAADEEGNRRDVYYTTVFYYWSRGCIRAEPRDREAMKKMLEIAKKLKARVQGEDGEFCTEKSLQGWPD